ncbi:MAG: transcription termination factor NusA [Candidatus Pacearchaeota archaeon]
MDLKAIETSLQQIEEERGIPREKIISAIEDALATAYKKDYGKKGQIIRAKFDLKTGNTEFSQIKIVVDDSMILKEKEESPDDPENRKVRFNPEHHIMLEEAKKIKKDIQIGEEMIFPLETKGDYGRIASQTAKQVIMQKLREAEKESIFKEFKKKEGEIISGIVQKIEGGNVFVDLNRTVAILPKEEQIRGESYRNGERIKALILSVEETSKGINILLSRSHPKMLIKLFEMEVPEISAGIVEIKNVAREAGSRSKIAVFSKEEDVDPVGSCVGQRGTRVNTITAELGGEKIDIVEWSDDIIQFISNALSPAKILNVEIKKKPKEEDIGGEAEIIVDEDQLSLAIGRSGQNVRLAAKLTGWKLNIKSKEGKSIASVSENGEIVEMEENNKVL